MAGLKEAGGSQDELSIRRSENADLPFSKRTELQHIQLSAMKPALGRSERGSGLTHSWE